MRRFDELSIKSRLSPVEPSARTVFAAACAQRLYPAYSRFRRKARIEGEKDDVRAALEVLWDDLIGGKTINRSELKVLIDRVRSLVPDEEEAAAANEPYAEDAVEALVYALSTRDTGSVEAAVWAARCAYEAADGEASRASASRRYDEDAIVSDPRVQRELESQERDIQLLQSISTGDHAVFESIRSYAIAEPLGGA